MLEEKDIEIIKGLLEENNLKLETRLEAKLEEKLEAKLEEKLEAKLEEKLEAKLEEKLEAKLEEKLEANNIKLEERIITKVVNQITEFVGAKFEEQTAWIQSELDKKPSKEDLFAYVDRKIIPLELDVDRLKYLNRNELKKLPEQRIIREELIKAGIE